MWGKDADSALAWPLQPSRPSSSCPLARARTRPSYVTACGPRARRGRHASPPRPTGSDLPDRRRQRPARPGFSVLRPRIPVADQALVDFLGSLVHGPELGTLRVHVGAPAEITKICGGGRVVACYAVGASRMYVPDQAVEGASLEYVLAHEYGHHIASWRSNAPWDAVDWGPKHWASAMRVCTYVRRGWLFPGSQGRPLPRRPRGGLCGLVRAPQPAGHPLAVQRAHETDRRRSQCRPARRAATVGWPAQADVPRHARPRAPRAHLQAATQPGRQRACGAATAGRVSALRWSSAPATSPPRKRWERRAASALNGAAASGSSV